MDSHDTSVALTSRPLPGNLVEGLLRLCQGDFAFRLPRNLRRDEEDTAAFFVNTIAEELGRIIATSRSQEQRLASFVTKLSEGLIAVAAGNFAVQIERDFSGDSLDVATFLVNNTITELGHFVQGAEERAEEDRVRLERLVAQRTAELERLAITDPLTGIHNRRHIFELAESERDRAVRYKSALGVAMLDLDHFKAINDRYGHAFGDRVLRMVSDSIRAQLRTVDLLGRYGGEEFMILLPATPIDATEKALLRVCRAVAALSLKHREAPVPITVSVGAVTLRGEETLEQTLQRADAALFRAKHAGRNRIEIERP